MTLNCYYDEFAENFGAFRRFARQQLLQALLQRGIRSGLLPRNN